MQHLQDIFGTAHLVEPVMHERGAVGKRVVSHAGLRAGVPPDGMKEVGIGFEMSHHGDSATDLQPADIDPGGIAMKSAEQS